MKVKQITVDNKVAYGITDGKKWFFYAYKNKSKAEEILNDSSIKNQLVFNVAYPKPLCIV